MTVLFLLGLLAFLKGTDSASAVVSDGSNSDYTSPEITCPCKEAASGNDDCKTRFIAANQSTTVITWNEDSIFTFPPGLPKTLAAASPKKNSAVGAGTYVIRYSTVDGGGRRSSCEFIIEVVRAQCPGLANVPHGRSTCRQGATIGQRCSVICDKGYEVEAANSVECLQTNKYSDTLPECKSIAFYTKVCDSLEKDPDDQVIANVQFNMNKMMVRLQQIGSLTSYQALKRARLVCVDPNLKEHAACVFIRRYDLLANILSDPSHKTKPYRALLMWHPEIKVFCHQKSSLDSLYAALPNVDKFLTVAYQTTFETTMTNLYSTQTTFLRQESINACSKKTELTHCISKDIFELVDRAKLFLDKKTQLGNKWRNRELKQYFNALTFSTILIKWDYYNRVSAAGPQSNRAEQNVLTEILRTLSEFVDDGADEKVRFVTKMFPERVTDKICNRGKMCMFWRVVDQTRLYVGLRKESSAGGQKVKVRVIDTTMNMREFVQRRQMDRILQMLADQEYNLIAVAQDLKSEFNKVINNRFTELKSYFKQVQDFNAKIAQADLVVITQIRKTSNAATAMAKEIDSIAKKILISMITTASLNLANKIAKLALVILENCNPLKAATDFSPSDIYNAASEVAAAAATLVKATMLFASIKDLAAAGKVVATEIQKNQKFLSVMDKTMEAVVAGNKTSNFTETKNAFLASYDSYDPRLKRHQITDMGALYKNMMSEACGLIDSTDGMASAIPKGIVGGLGLCWQVQIKIDKVITMYESIFDKQFEMTEVLARNVRAQVAIEAANGMVAEYDSVAKEPSVSDDVLQKLRQMAGMSYLSYRVMVIQALRLYCDKLEYNNGGNRPSICKDTATDISRLLAYVPNRCTMKLEYVTMRSYPRGYRDRAYLNMASLYAGNETTFKIPNSKWLYMNRWITKADMNSTIYVSGIEIYLPTNVSTRVNVRTDAYVEGTNELKPGGIQYELRPKRPMRFEYAIGSQQCRLGHKYDSPYTTCQTKKLPAICPQTEYPCVLDIGDRPYLPSIFSTFKVRVFGYETLPVPKATHLLPIRIGLRTCTFVPGKITDEGINDFKEQGPPRVGSKCCSSNSYWSSRYKSCSTCPVNSTMALNGLYCQRNN